ncbi:hypothetical protein CDL15_Pgr018343 [Punica granatum]|uniref:Uncharacterized protein n=1 Tax=Punica granatum TaxID=22663 RepID=A0A218WIW9_PUNGR|nr:hypothetical protein CDL15_Pgr018343 [Punica granatum]
MMPFHSATPLRESKVARHPLPHLKQLISRALPRGDDCRYPWSGSVQADHRWQHSRGKLLCFLQQRSIPTHPLKTWMSSQLSSKSP